MPSRWNSSWPLSSDAPRARSTGAVDGRLERVGVPQLERVDRLHVVVGVHKDGRRVRVLARPLGEHGGQPRPVVEDLDGREAGAPRGVGEPLRAAAHVLVVFRLRADARDAQPLVEVGEQVVAVFVDVFAFGGHRPDDSVALVTDDDSVVIVGAGLMGAASAWALARRGRPVTLVEQFELGHQQGSSHGSARIVRRVYGDALYIELTGYAFERWDELSAESGATPIRILGGLDFGSPRNVAGDRRDAHRAKVPHELLPAAEAARRWPGMNFDGDVIFHPQAGVLDPDVARARDGRPGARGAGATVLEQTAATAVRPSATGSRCAAQTAPS